MRLERVIISGIPHMSKAGAVLRPVFQLFQGQNSLYSSSLEYLLPSNSSIPSYFPTDMSLSFEVGVLLEGDILARCRHFHVNGARETVFRCLFHTSFIYNGLLRLGKPDLDLACDDRRVPADFQVDFFFSGEERKEGEERFWRSVEHKKAVGSPGRAPLTPGSASHSDSDEEKVDLALIAKYEREMSESGGEEEDLADYLSALESKGTHKAA